MDKVKISDLYSSVPELIAPLFENKEYPWQALSEIKEYAKVLIKKGMEGYTLLKENVLVGENVKIYDGVCIEGVAVIGSDTVLRPGAFLRGNVIIGEGCVIGNSTELKNCVLMDKVQVPHYNYVGDSVLGFHAHMGAGAVCSNLKADGKSVVVRGEKSYDTSLRKVGAFLGDDADIGCGCVLNPGTVVGKGTRVYPLVCLRNVIPEGMIVKNKSAVEISKNTDI